MSYAKKIIRHTGAWVQVPQIRQKDGATVFGGAHYSPGEYKILRPFRRVPDGAELLAEHEDSGFIDAEGVLQLRKQRDRQALQCIPYCLTRHIHPSVYWDEVGFLHISRDAAVPTITAEAWGKLPAGLREFADRPRVDYVLSGGEYQKKYAE
jgi:hypothetical protein